MKLTIWLNSLVRIGLFLLPTSLFAQSLTLIESQNQARENYPSIKQKDLIRQTADFTIQNHNKGYLPQIALNGQATYQSEVTRVDIPLPGVTINPMDKDQYKATADINQIVFDGGLISNQKQLQKLNAEVEQEKIEVELYKLKDRINQLYLGILLLDEQIKQIELVKADIKTGIRKTEALVKNGVSFRSNLHSLQAELLKTEQRNIELKSSRKGLIKTLALFLGKPLDENIQLETPQFDQLAPEIKRPELNLFEKQTDLVNQQKKLLLAKNIPKASLFGQGGYGRPGLNMLQNEFDWFYIAGVRLNWNISNLYTYKKEKQLIDISSKSIGLQQDAFILNTNTQLTQQHAEINKLKDLIESDKQIIALREKVKIAAKAQLENEVISTSDYLREVNAEDQARQLLITHQLQLLQAKLNYNTIAGI
ncbi:MAG: TolC family protein [Sphingobacteriaceae bacterium]